MDDFVAEKYRREANERNVISLRIAIMWLAVPMQLFLINSILDWYLFLSVLIQVGLFANITIFAKGYPEIEYSEGVMAYKESCEKYNYENDAKIDSFRAYIDPMKIDYAITSQNINDHRRNIMRHILLFQMITAISCGIVRLL